VRKRLLAVLGFIIVFVSPSYAGTEDYKRGIQEGIKIGMAFEREKLKQELSEVKDVALRALNYKYYLIKGEVPPPLLVSRLVEKKRKDGFVVLSAETKILPPAFFPVSLFQDVRKTYFGKDVSVIPKGWAVVLDTKRLPTYKIAYYKWLAETSGYEPVYDYLGDRLFFVVRDREADAESDKRYLSGIGIPDLEVAKIKEELVIKGKEIKDDLAEDIRKTAEEILEKEKQVAGVKVGGKGTLTEVVSYLQKALASVQALDPKRYDRLNLYQLEKDLEAILSTLGEAVALQEKYDVVITLPSDEGETGKKVEVKQVEVKKPSPLERLEAVEKMLK